MKPLTILQRIKQTIATIGWKLFLWGNDYTAELYWEIIYEQEKPYHQKEEETR
jgi:hypothetical protein